MLDKKINPLRIAHALSVSAAIGFYIHVIYTAYSSTATLVVLGREAGLINGSMIIVGIMALNLMTYKLFWPISWRSPIGYAGIIALLVINFLILGTVGLMRE